MIDYCKELNAKAYGALERLVREHEQGKLTTAQFDAGLNTLWNVCAGLCEPQFMELYNRLRIAHDGSFRELRAFIDPHSPKLILARHKAQSEAVNLLELAFEAGSWATKSTPRAFDSCAEAQHFLNKLCSALHSKGFQLLN